MKVMILGASGMLGGSLCRIMKKRGLDIVSVGRHDCDYNLDCLDFVALGKIISKERVTAIVNCIAIVSLINCEKDYERAWKTHVGLPKFLSEIQGIYNVYISTDSVYSGDNNLWSEEDLASPVNVYAKTKLGGEVPTLFSQGLVLRTNIYGIKDNLKGSSLFEWAYRSLHEGSNITGYDNVYFNPLSTEQLSNVIVDILSLERLPRGEIYNVGCQEIISKYEFICYIASLYNPKSIKVKKSKLIDTDGVKRPKNTALNIEKFNSILGHQYSIYDGISSLVDKVRFI